jgi:hypothetical protein
MIKQVGINGLWIWSVDFDIHTVKVTWPWGSKTTSTNINVWQFSSPYFFLDVSSRFQYYLWLVDSVDSRNMIDCDKLVVMWPNVSMNKNYDTESYKIILLHLAIIDLIWFHWLLNCLGIFMFQLIISNIITFIETST